MRRPLTRVLVRRGLGSSGSSLPRRAVRQCPQMDTPIPGSGPGHPDHARDGEHGLDRSISRDGCCRERSLAVELATRGRVKREDSPRALHHRLSVWAADAPDHPSGSPSRPRVGCGIGSRGGCGIGYRGGQRRSMGDMLRSRGPRTGRPPPEVSMLTTLLASGNERRSTEGELAHPSRVRDRQSACSSLWPPSLDRNIRAGTRSCRLQGGGKRRSPGDKCARWA